MKMVNRMPLRVGGRNVQDFITLICGGLLFISPWILKYVGDANAARTSWVCGAAVLILAVVELASFAEWMEWLSLLFGACLIIAPWAIGFASLVYPTAAQVVLGVIVVIASISELWSLGHTEAAAH
jgi:SPW repeat